MFQLACCQEIAWQIWSHRLFVALMYEALAQVWRLVSKARCAGVWRQAVVWTTWVIVAVILLMVISTYNMFPNYKDQESWRALPFPGPPVHGKAPVDLLMVHAAPACLQRRAPA